MPENSSDRLPRSCSCWGPGPYQVVGALELGATIGLVLTAVIRVAHALVGLAALGLALLMIGAAVINQRLDKSRDIVINAVLLGLAAAVTWPRFGPYPL